MQLPPSITFRGVERSEDLEADILSRVRRLETFFRPIMACRVLVEFSERRHGSGNRYHVRIDLTVPEQEIVVKHEASRRAEARALGLSKLPRPAEPDPEHKHVRVAIREAFDVARRRLQDYARRRRRAVKAHIAMPRGHVVRLPRGKPYGFLEAADGHEVYFQKGSVLNDAFDRLKVGTVVAFVEEKGEKGPQASTVRMTGA